MRIPCPPLAPSRAARQPPFFTHSRGVVPKGRAPPRAQTPSASRAAAAGVIGARAPDHGGGTGAGAAGAAAATEPNGTGHARARGATDARAGAPLPPSLPPRAPRCSLVLASQVVLFLSLCALYILCCPTIRTALRDFAGAASSFALRTHAACAAAGAGTVGGAETRAAEAEAAAARKRPGRAAAAMAATTTATMIRPVLPASCELASMVPQGVTGLAAARGQCAAQRARHPYGAAHTSLACVTAARATCARTCLPWRPR